jgi:hypothetical protein
VNEDIVVPIAFFATIVVIATVVPIVRALIRRWEREPALPPSTAGSDVRLERIEQAIEAMALEVERISEGQRFTAKLLAERSAEPAPRERADQRADPARRTS